MNKLNSDKLYYLWFVKIFTFAESSVLVLRTQILKTDSRSGHLYILRWESRRCVEKDKNLNTLF